MRLHCISFLSLLAALFCCSCEKDGGKVSVTFESEQYYVLTGHQIQIDFKLQPETADPMSLAWSSSDESVATVSAGYVTGVSAGTATISARIGKSTASATVTVSDIDVKEFEVSGPLEVKPGGTVEILVTGIQPDYADATNINWSKVDAPGEEYFSIAAVEKDRVIVRCHDDAENGCKCQICGLNKSKTLQRYATVTAVDRPLSGLSLSKTALTLAETESATLSYTVNPSNTTDELDVVWSSSNPAVASIDGTGNTVTVNALKEGVSTITVKDRISGKSADCGVTVTFNRIIKPDCKVGFYLHAFKVIEDKLYKLEGNPVNGSTITFLPRVTSEKYYIGLDDGYALCKSDMDVSVTLSGALYSECRFLMYNPASCYGLLDNNMSGELSVCIPNGSSASLVFKARVSSIAMEKAVDGNFSCFGKNVSYSSPGGSFTITRPGANTTDKYQFCLNSGSSVNNLYAQGPARGFPNDDIRNPYSTYAGYYSFTCGSYPKSQIDSRCRISVSSSTPPGTYTFVPASNMGVSDVSFAVVIK